MVRVALYFAFPEKSRRSRFIYVCPVARNDKHTLCVISACASYRIDKCLIERVGHLVSIGFGLFLEITA